MCGLLWFLTWPRSRAWSCRQSRLHVSELATSTSRSTTSAGVTTSCLLRPIAAPYKSRTRSCASVISGAGSRMMGPASAGGTAASVLSRPARAVEQPARFRPARHDRPDVHDATVLDDVVGIEVADRERCVVAQDLDRSPTRSGQSQPTMKIECSSSKRNTASSALRGRRVTRRQSCCRRRARSGRNAG